MGTNEDSLEDIDGVIQSIRVRNFLCHDNLEVNFNRNLNFIVGRNGSGKSAILTAVVVGLGGRAAVTNRGQSIVAFIKRGTSSATVEIKLKNSSSNGYRRNVYGDHITIVRTINSSGSSTYKVKSASGSIISTKSEDVHLIVQAFDIQIDNPICILNQDEARNFHAADAKKKFTLFRRATNLDETEANYTVAVSNCEKAKKIWEKKNEAFTELEKELRHWEKKYHQMQTKEELRVMQRKLQDEYYWSEITELEKQTHGLKQEYEERNLNVEKISAEMENVEAGLVENKKSIGSLASTIRELKENKEALETKSSITTRNLATAQENLRRSQILLNNKKFVLQREQKKVADLESEIHKIRYVEHGDRTRALETELKDVRGRIEENRARLATLTHERTQADADLNRNFIACENTRTRVKEVSEKHSRLTREIRDIEQTKDQLVVYGRNMPRLVERIQKLKGSGYFTEMPRGPVGAYIKVKDTRWLSAVEHVIGGTLSTFCVTNMKDLKKLQKIMEEVYSGDSNVPPITASLFMSRVHDVSPNKVRAEPFVSLYDVLEISDPVIANYLIDALKIEHTLLVPTRDNGLQLCEEIENVPRNCRKVVCEDCTELSPSPNFKCYGGDSRPPKYLQVSRDERKVQLARKLKAVRDELTTLEKEMTTMNEQVSRGEKRLDKVVRDSQELGNLQETLQRKARDIEEDVRDIGVGHIQLLTEDLEDIKSRLPEHIETFNTASANNEICSSENKALEEKDQNLRRELRKTEKSITTASENLAEEQQTRDQYTSEYTKLKSRKDDEHKKTVELNTTITQNNKVISEKVTSALELCPRIEKPRDKELVLKELKNLDPKIRAIHVEGLSREQVGAELLRVQRRHSTASKVIRRLLSLIEKVKSTSQDHLMYCYRVQASVIRQVQFSFQQMLSLRDYSGSMDIDVNASTLELVCTGRDSLQKRVAKTANSLSGGERSYATIAFIMSLWDCVDLPFYFLDEFDVFMDNINRKIVMDILKDHAEVNQNRQFVLLTPQDASKVEAGPNIAIHRMADPHRSAV